MFIDELNNDWIGLYSTILATRDPGVGLGVLDDTTPVGGPTTHFTTFSVLVGEYSAENTGNNNNNGGDGGDGDLSIILPAVLVPVVVGGVVVVAIVVATTAALVSWLKWKHSLSAFSPAETAVEL